ncbi:MAG: Rdx family protein [Anaerolineae bacterium]|nr:Rdx family protein [Anaerolineae bacterium]MBL8104444.1 Rdx family protein [Anaerolineales bacterium]MCC7189518.1 Rdx family protein [Anaerolineales bacterium]
MGELLRHYEHVIEEIKLIPSDEGRFEVTVNGQLLFSKSQLHRHAEAGEVVELVRKLVGE